MASRGGPGGFASGPSHPMVPKGPAAAAVKRPLVIKPFKSAPQVVVEDLGEATWRRLHAALAAVAARSPVEVSKEELCQSVESACMHRLGGLLHARLSAECAKYVDAAVDALGKESSSDSAAFLQRVVGTWRDLCEYLVTVRNIFIYLDRSYVLSTPGALGVVELGMKLFRDRLEQNSEVEKRIVVSLLTSIQHERDGYGVDRDAIQRVLRMFMSLGVYASRFEGPFLWDSWRYFQADVQKHLPGGGSNSVESGGRPSAVALGTDAAGSSSSSPASASAGAALAQYLQYADRRLQQAVDMASAYLAPATRQPLLSCIEQCAITPHVPALLQLGFAQLLDGGLERLPDIRRAFVLFDRVQQSEKLKEAWAIYMKNYGMEALTELANATSNNATTNTTSASSGAIGPSTGNANGGAAPNKAALEYGLIDNLISFYGRMEVLLKQAFQSLEAFRSALRSSFEYVLNDGSGSGGGDSRRRNRPAELLCKYMDRKLSGAGAASASATATSSVTGPPPSLSNGVEQDVDAALDRALVLFRHIQGQDAFEVYYKKYLARRLLLERSSNDEQERTMIRKLKAECGANFTSKMEGMLMDMELSRDVATAYAEHLQIQASGGSVVRNNESGALSPARGRILEAKINVLTVGYWPTYPAIGLSLPHDVTFQKQQFEAFYSARYTGRRLAWVHYLDRVLLGAQFGKGRKELDMALTQAVVLLCFNGPSANQVPSFSYADLQRATQLDAPLLRACLAAMCVCPPALRLLSKSVKQKEIDEANDVFSLVPDVANKLFRIKYRHVEAREGGAASREDEVTQEEIVRERQHCIDAALVRIMKSRKRLAHQDLLAETMGQLRFPVAASDIKKRVEALIEREYLCRDEASPGVYNYLA